MKLTPAIKGQLTKQLKLKDEHGNEGLFCRIRTIFERHMPKEQAKHATRKLLAQHDKAAYYQSQAA